PILLGLAYPLERHRMVLGDIAAFHQNRLAMLQIDPVVRHGPSPERCPQTGDRWAVSKTGLMLDEGGAEQTRSFLKQIAFLVGVLCPTHERECVGPVDWNLSVTEFLSSNPGTITGLADFLCDTIDRLVPRDVDPVIRSRSAIAGLS